MKISWAYRITMLLALALTLAACPRQDAVQDQSRAARAGHGEEVIMPGANVRARAASPRSLSLQDAMTLDTPVAATPIASMAPRPAQSAGARNTPSPESPWIRAPLPASGFGAVLKAANQVASELPPSEGKAFQMAMKVVMLDELDKMVQGAKVAPTEQAIEQAMVGRVGGKTPWAILVESKQIEDRDLRNRQATPLEDQ